MTSILDKFVAVVEKNNVMDLGGLMNSAAVSTDWSEVMTRYLEHLNKKTNDTFKNTALANDVLGKFAYALIRVGMQLAAFQGAKREQLVNMMTSALVSIDVSADDAAKFAKLWAADLEGRDTTRQARNVPGTSISIEDKWKAACTMLSIYFIQRQISKHNNMDELCKPIRTAAGNLGLKESIVNEIKLPFIACSCPSKDEATLTLLGTDPKVYCFVEVVSNAQLNVSGKYMPDYIQKINAAVSVEEITQINVQFATAANQTRVKDAKKSTNLFTSATFNL
jgi:hypothetical protein